MAHQASHSYNTRGGGVLSEILPNEAVEEIKSCFRDSIKEVKDEIITLKDVIIKNLQSENTRLRNKVEKLEINLQELFIKNNCLEQYD